MQLLANDPRNVSRRLFCTLRLVDDRGRLTSFFYKNDLGVPFLWCISCLSLYHFSLMDMVSYIYIRKSGRANTENFSFLFSMLFISIFSLLAVGHKLLAWSCVGVVVVGVVVYNFYSLFSSETTAQNTSKLYIQLPYIRVYKNSSFHVDPIVDVDFIGL